MRSHRPRLSCCRTSGACSPSSSWRWPCPSSCSRPSPALSRDPRPAARRPAVARGQPWPDAARRGGRERGRRPGRSCPGLPRVPPARPCHRALRRGRAGVARRAGGTTHPDGPPDLPRGAGRLGTRVPGTDAGDRARPCRRTAPSGGPAALTVAAGSRGPRRPAVDAYRTLERPARHRRPRFVRRVVRGRGASRRPRAALRRTRRRPAPRRRRGALVPYSCSGRGRAPAAARGHRDDARCRRSARRALRDRRRAVRAHGLRTHTAVRPGPARRDGGAAIRPAVGRPRSEPG